MPFAAQRVVDLLITLLWPRRSRPKRNQALQRGLVRAILPSSSPPKVSQHSYPGPSVDGRLLCVLHSVCNVRQLQVGQLSTKDRLKSEMVWLSFSGTAAGHLATTFYKACMTSRSCYLSEAEANPFVVGLIGPVDVLQWVARRSQRAGQRVACCLRPSCRSRRQR